MSPRTPRICTRPLEVSGGQIGHKGRQKVTRPQGKEPVSKKGKERFQSQTKPSQRRSVELCAKRERSGQPVSQPANQPPNLGAKVRLARGGQRGLI